MSENTTELLAPPIAGTGSGKKPWRAYAKATSPDTPGEVIDAMSANEVQQMLYAQGVLVKDDDNNDAKPSDDETSLENE